MSVRESKFNFSDAFQGAFRQRFYAPYGVLRAILLSDVSNVSNIKILVNGEIKIDVHSSDAIELVSQISIDNGMRLFDTGPNRMVIDSKMWACEHLGGGYGIVELEVEFARIPKSGLEFSITEISAE